LSQLRLIRPLVFFDLETTGTDPQLDKIVEIAALRLEPGGGRDTRRRRVNPERPIPPGATAVHGITDADVRDEPPFRRIARGLLDWIGEADLAGFNVRRFDLIVLERELRDCGLDLALGRRRVVDAMTIFHRMERRDLAAAVRFYCGHEHSGAHSAQADVEAAAEVLEAQLARYPELPRTVEALDAWTRPDAEGDRAAKFVWRPEGAVFCFGKHQGRTLREVATQAPDYLQWILASDFPSDAKDLVRLALAGEFPERDQSA
jgi:DNA polymerase-3 subunit epsilon